MARKETAVKAGLALVSFAHHGLNRFLYALDRVGRHRRACVLGLGALTVIVRLLLLPWIPVPEPTVYDEFSYLLGADTLASGRLTNPPHPLSQFFENGHVLSRPTYASKYQPGQALFLALGQVLFGHPFYGVVLSVGLLVAGICWMLQAWVPPGWALAGGLYCLLTFFSGHYWMESYWGGAVAAFASALLLGAYRRITRHGRLGFSWLLAGAVFLLFLTRPYEGGLLALFVAGALAHWAFRTSRLPLRRLAKRVLFPAALVLAAGAAFQGYYNWRVTGSPFDLPYLLYQRQYNFAPALWILPRTDAKASDSAEVNAEHSRPEPDTYRSIREMPWTQKLQHLPGRVLLQVRDLFGQLADLVLVMALLFWSDRAVRWLVLAAAAVGAGLLLETWMWLHYMAPLVVVLLALLPLVARRLRQLRWRGRVVGPLLLCVLPVYMAGPPAHRLTRFVLGVVQERLVNPPAAKLRTLLSNRLSRQGGKHLVIVRCLRQPETVHQWVYNRASMEAAPVLWARDRGDPENRSLVDYSRDRKIWLLEPDLDPSSLRPYP